MFWANARLRLLVTAACNLDCFYCHNEGTPKGAAYLSDSLFARVEELVLRAEEPLDRVTFSGGEPLLHPRLERFVERLAPYSGTRTIVTNGLLLDQPRVRSLASAGVTRVRVGVDSLARTVTRPTSKVPVSRAPIMEVIESLGEHGIEVELNVVLTHYNSDELRSLLSYCLKNSVSVKFFEHVSVAGLRTASAPLAMEPCPYVSFDVFQKTVMTLMPRAVHTQPAHLLGTNDVFTDGGVTVRYCRLLCEKQVCHITGTRIGPAGQVYVCMVGSNRFVIHADETLAASATTIEQAVEAGCAKKHGWLAVAV